MVVGIRALPRVSMDRSQAIRSYGSSDKQLLHPSISYNHRNKRRCGGQRNAMMGSRLQTTAMFQYFCLDDWVPADHLLRAIDRHIDLRPIPRAAASSVQ